MSDATKQAIADACADVLAELDDMHPGMASTNAHLVEAIDNLIAARIEDALLGERPPCSRDGCGHSADRHETRGGFCKHCTCHGYAPSPRRPGSREGGGGGDHG